VIINKASGRLSGRLDISVGRDAGSTSLRESRMIFSHRRRPGFFMYGGTGGLQR